MLDQESGKELIVMFVVALNFTLLVMCDVRTSKIQANSFELSLLSGTPCKVPVEQGVQMVNLQ